MKTCTFGKRDFFTDQSYKLYATSFRFIDHAISSLQNYLLNRNNGIESDAPEEAFPSAGFEALKIKHSTYKPRGPRGEAYWPDTQERYWWRLTLEDDSITEDFYWEKDEARGWPDKNDKDVYWFSVYHVPSKTKIEGFSIGPNRIKGYPDRNKRYWSYIKYTQCGPIEQWMKKKDKKYLQRLQPIIEQEEDVIFLKTVKKKARPLFDEDSNVNFSDMSPFSPIPCTKLYDEELVDSSDAIETSESEDHSRMNRHSSQYKTEQIQVAQVKPKIIGEEMFILPNRILGGPLPELPKLPCNYSWLDSPFTQFETRLILQPLKYLGKYDADLETPLIENYYYHDHEMVASIKHCFSKQASVGLIQDHERGESIQQNPPTIDMILYAHSPIQEYDKVIFILANSNEETFVPPIQDIQLSTLRIILVVAAEQYDKLKGYTRKGLDILCVKYLNSPTHGNYAPHLATMNSLRIATLIFAIHLQQKFNIKRIIMANDNIVGLYYTRKNHYASQDNAPLSDSSTQNMDMPPLSEQWESFYTQLEQYLAEQHECVCLSVAAFSDGKLKKEFIEPNLGSKVFMIDLVLLNKKIISLNDIFYLFFPADTTHFFGEDYLFQLSLNRVFDNSSKFSVCNIAPSKKFALMYRKQGRDKQLKAEEVVNHILNKEIESYFDRTVEDNPEYTKLHPFSIAALTRYKEIVNENKKRWLAELEKLITADLVGCFLNANGVLMEDEPEPDLPPPIEHKRFLTFLKNSIKTIVELVDNTGRSLVREYQKDILIQAIASIDKGISSGLFEMATGAGKTYVQIYLAIAAYLTGDTRPIFIVTPYQQLVEQAYQDFIKVIDIMSRQESCPVFPKSKVLKVSADCRNVSAGILKLNRTLEHKSHVFITCSDSYRAIINDGGPEKEYLDPCMLFFDESHLQSSVEARYDPETCFMADLSATPRFFNSLNHFHIVYTREQAVRDNILTPCVLAKFEFEFSLKNVELIIAHFAQLYTTLKRPDGRFLSQCKAMVFVPNNNKGVSYVQLLEAQCKIYGISHFSSYGREGQLKLDLFRKEEGSCIAICKEMGTIGFNDNEVDTIIFLRKSSETESAIMKIAQAAGRSLRASIQQVDKKIAYIITFNMSDTRLLFESENTFYDSTVLDRCEESYRKHLTDGLQETIQLQDSKFVSIFQEIMVNKRQTRKRKRGLSLPQRSCSQLPSVHPINSERDITSVPIPPTIEDFGQRQIALSEKQSLQTNGGSNDKPSLTPSHLQGFFLNMQSSISQVLSGYDSRSSTSVNPTPCMPAQNISCTNIFLNSSMEKTKTSTDKSLPDNSSSRMSYDPTNHSQLFSMPPKHTDPSAESDEEIYLRPEPVHFVSDTIENSSLEEANLIIRQRVERERLSPLTPAPNPPLVISEKECRRIGRLGEKVVYDLLKEHYRKKYCNHPAAIMKDNFVNPNVPYERGFQINSSAQNGESIELRVIWYNKDIPQEQDWMKNHDIKVIKNGKERFIEIKTTKSTDSGDVTLTGAEWDLMLTAGNRYYIFRVFDVDSDNPQVKKIKNPGAKLQKQEISVEAARLSINFRR